MALAEFGIQKAQTHGRMGPLPKLLWPSQATQGSRGWETWMSITVNQAWGEQGTSPAGRLAGASAKEQIPHKSKNVETGSKGGILPF